LLGVISGIGLRKICSHAQQIGALPLADCEQAIDIIIAEHVDHGRLPVWNSLPFINHQL